MATKQAGPAKKAGVKQAAAKRTGATKGSGSEKSEGMVRATLVKSTIGANPSIKATVESLGFRKMNQTRDLPDNPAVRGMLKAANHLIAVEGEPFIRPKRSQYKIWRARSNKKHKRGH